MAGVSGFWRYADADVSGGGDDSFDDATADADCSIVFISTSGTCLLSFVVSVVAVVVAVAVVVDGDGDDAVDVVVVAANDAFNDVDVVVFDVAATTPRFGR